MLFGTRALLPLLAGLATASQHDDDACGQLHQKYLKQGNSCESAPSRPPNFSVQLNNA